MEMKFKREFTVSPEQLFNLKGICSYKSELIDLYQTIWAFGDDQLEKLTSKELCKYMGWGERYTQQKTLELSKTGLITKTADGKSIQSIKSI